MIGLYSSIVTIKGQMEALVVLICSFLAVSGELCCRNPGLYPHGPHVGDDILTNGDDQTVVQYTGNFQYFGAAYTDLFVSTNGPFSFGTAYNDWTVNNQPKDVPIFAAFGDDISLNYNSGQIAFRKVFSDAGGEFDRAQDDVARVGGNITVDSLIIVTWEDVRRFGQSWSPSSNTFQVVLVQTTDDEMFAIFNYAQIHWIAEDTLVGFNKGDDSTLVALETDALVTDSNMGCPGRVVKRLDDPDFDQPMSPEVRQCQLRVDGEVTTFASLKDQLPSGQEIDFVLSQDVTDPCKLHVVVRLDLDGHVEMVSVRLGVDPMSPYRHQRLYNFYRYGCEIVVRGTGLNDAETVEVPYSWARPDGESTVDIVGTEKGWRLCDVMCGYTLTIHPLEEDFASLAVDDDSYYWFEGACGDNSE